MSSIILHGEKVVFGDGAINALEELKGNKAFVVTGGKSTRKYGYLNEVLNKLNSVGLKTAYFDGVEPDPSIETVMKGAKMMQEFLPDFIVALGGGSAMDAAKAMWIFYEYPEKDFEDIIKPNVIPPLRNKAKFVAIPTTSGTGSEVTRAMVITDKEKNLKMGFGSMEILPDLAILEPKYTLSLPPGLTASTGMDAFTHALEAYTSTKANDFSDVLALGAIGGLFEYIPRAYKDGQNLEYREKLLNYQAMAGMAFSNVSLGIVHSLAHQLGGIYHIQHGLANAIILPYIIEFNSFDETAKERYEDVAQRLGVADLVEAIRELNQKIGIPAKLSELDISKDDFESKLDLMSERALNDGCTKTNPRPVTQEQFKNLYQCIFEGLEVDF